jgi:hypothetical protein
MSKSFIIFLFLLQSCCYTCITTTTAFTLLPQSASSSLSTKTKIQTRRIISANKCSPIITSLSSTSLQSTQSNNDEEFHPSDPASTTPQLLSSLWLQIAQGCKNLAKGVSF